MNEILASLLAWAVANTAYESPPGPPALDFLSAAAFAAQACPAKAHCAARGFYQDGTARVVMHEAYRDLASVQQRAMLVHELVHYLQDLSGRYTGEKTCDVWIEREREAFRIQLRYMTQQTHDRNVKYRMPLLSRRQCEKVRAAEADESPA